MGIFRYAGIDLSTLGAAPSMADGVKGAPPVRGKNLLIPYQHGQRWAQKFYDERPLVIQGLITGVSGIALDAAADNLKKLFPIGAGEQKLEVQQADLSLRYVMAEVRNSLIQMEVVKGTKAVKWSLELVASDPIWYGSALEAASGRFATWTLDSGVLLDDGTRWLDTTAAYFAQTVSSSPANVEATNSGTIFTRKPILYLRGAMVNPLIFNLRNNYSLQLMLTTAGTDQLVVDCGAQTVTKNGILQPPNVAVLGPGQVDWMHLEPGDNTLKITPGAVPPSVAYQALYSPAYL